MRPGFTHEAQVRASDLLRDLTYKASQQYRISVPYKQAAAHILTTNIGVTLRQIILAEEDRELSIAVREGVIAAITGQRESTGILNAIREVAEFTSAEPSALGRAETMLLLSWLKKLADSSAGTPDNGSLPAEAEV